MYPRVFLTSMSQGCHADTGLQGGYGVSCYQLGDMQSQHIHRSLVEVGCSCEIADSFSGLHFLTDNGFESGLLWDSSIDKVISVAWLSAIDRLHQSCYGEDEVRVVR